MTETNSRRSVRWWSATYIALLLPASVLAYVGIGWISASERGWQTQAAAASLVAAWLLLGAGATFALASTVSSSRLNLVKAILPISLASVCYAISLAWGGRMLI